jgi:hypothetical protein
VDAKPLILAAIIALVVVGGGIVLDGVATRVAAGCESGRDRGGPRDYESGT